MQVEIEVLFRELVLGRDPLGLLSKELFAVGGGKLYSNAANEWSGTQAELGKKRSKLERVV